MIYKKSTSARGRSIMRLISTAEAFSHHGVPMVGAPVVLDDEMHIVEGPQRWLFSADGVTGTTGQTASLYRRSP